MKVPGVVDRERVTRHEADLATVILAEWNRQAGLSQWSKQWLAKIIMRIREHPELTFDDHAEAIRVNLCNPWWKGTPTLAVIYGNDAQFERSLAQYDKSPLGALEVGLATLRAIEQEKGQQP